jgi:tetraacyldisaccharide 4'-kinase
MKRKEYIPAGRYVVRNEGLVEKIFRQILAEEERSLWLAFLRKSAHFIAWFYDTLMVCRNLLFDRGIFKIHTLSCPVISVGNLVLGGTGKTPMVFYLANLLSAEGYRVAVVSRGYSGTKSRGVLIVSDGEKILADSGLTGDEPQLLARRLPGIPVLCSSRRSLAGKVAIDRFQCDLVILDDGFQHRRLARNLDVVMLDSRKPFGNGRIFPGGSLRERPSALARAQALVLSHFDGSRQAVKNYEDLRGQWHEKITATAANLPFRIFAAAEHKDRPLNSIKGARLAAFAGIARPDDFFCSVHKLGARIVYFAALPDHCRITTELLASFVQEARELQPEFWLTTEKDWVRLPRTVPEAMELWVVAVELDVHWDVSEVKTTIKTALGPFHRDSQDKQ